MAPRSDSEESGSEFEEEVEDFLINKLYIAQDPPGGAVHFIIHIKVASLFHLCCCYFIKHAHSHVLSTLPYKEEDEASKGETEEKKIIDPNGDGATEGAAKNIIEYCISFCYLPFTRHVLHRLERSVQFTYAGSWGCRLFLTTWNLIFPAGASQINKPLAVFVLNVDFQKSSDSY